MLTGLASHVDFFPVLRRWASRAAFRRAVVGAFFVIVLASVEIGAICPALSAPSRWDELSHVLQPRDFLWRIQLSSPKLQVSSVSGPPGHPIPLNIKYDNRNDVNGGVLFVLIGIPDGITLNVGGSLGKFWAVNSKVVDKLTLTAPAEFSGSFTLKIMQSGAEPGTARIESFTVTIAAEPQRTQTAAPPTAAPLAIVAPPATAAPPAIATPSAAPKRSPQEPMLMARAAELVTKGDFSQARGILEFLAGQGSPAAAFAMGETYDPLVLNKMAVKGLQADPAKAQRWYEKAEALGNAEARGRLNALATR